MPKIRKVCAAVLLVSHLSGCVATIDLAPPPRFVRVGDTPILIEDSFSVHGSWNEPEGLLDRSSTLSLMVEGRQHCRRSVVKQSGGRETIHRIIAPGWERLHASMYLLGGIGAVMLAYALTQHYLRDKPFSEPVPNSSDTQLTSEAEFAIFGGLVSPFLIPAIWASAETGSYMRESPVKRFEEMEDVDCPAAAAAKHRIELQLSGKTITLITDLDGTASLRIVDALKELGAELDKHGGMLPEAPQDSLKVDGKVAQDDGVLSQLRNGLNAWFQNEKDRKIRPEETETVREHERLQTPAPR